MGPGSQGAPVAWLQHSLGRLGHYQGMPTGEFDVPTIVGVRSLQGEMALTVDGTVGPETKIHIYQAIDTYPVPRLGPLAPLAGAERGAS
jgi:peptidoglycan hydrolase-like protein with peptidoglycan-binding domain